MDSRADWAGSERAKVEGAKSDWKDGFLFVANDPALDFVNTLPVINGEVVDLLEDYAALARWFRAAELVSAAVTARLLAAQANQAEQRKTLMDMLLFRETLRADVFALESGQAVRPGTIEALNELLARHPSFRRVVTAEGALALEEWFAPEFPRDLFGPLALAAAKFFAKADPARLRKCEHCALHFLDTSKNGTRRWCSMQMCGNRAKVAAFAERQRTGAY